MYSIVLSVSWLNLFSFSFLVCCWTPLLNFSVWLLYPSAVWFMFGTFLYFLSLLKFSLCALLSWHQLASLSPLFWKHYWVSWTSLMVQTVKRLPTMQETWVQSLGWEDLLEKEMATHTHGWRSMVGYSPWGHKESDMTEWLHFTSHASKVMLKIL